MGKHGKKKEKKERKGTKRNLDCNAALTDWSWSNSMGIEYCNYEDYSGYWWCVGPANLNSGRNQRGALAATTLQEWMLLLGLHYHPHLSIRWCLCKGLDLEVISLLDQWSLPHNSLITIYWSQYLFLCQLSCAIISMINISFAFCLECYRCWHPPLDSPSTRLPVNYTWKALVELPFDCNSSGGSTLRAKGNSNPGTASQVWLAWALVVAGLMMMVQILHLTVPCLAFIYLSYMGMV